MKKRVLWIVGVILVIAACFFYTRPRTLEERYPYLDISQCYEINGYCFTAFETEDLAFIIQSEDADFDRLLSMIRSAKLKTQLRNLLPQGTRTHSYSPGDYCWDVFLAVDDVPLPDGSVISGDVIHIKNFFGSLSIIFNGEIVQCSLDQQDQWTKNIMDVLSLYIVE